MAVNIVTRPAKPIEARGMLFNDHACIWNGAGDADVSQVDGTVLLGVHFHPAGWASVHLTLDEARRLALLFAAAEIARADKPEEEKR